MSFIRPQEGFAWTIGEGKGKLGVGKEKFSERKTQRGGLLVMRFNAIAILGVEDDLS